MNDTAAIRYDLLSPPRIVFGWGRRQEVGPLARALGQRAFLVTGSRTLSQQPAFQQILRSLADAGVKVVPLAEVRREPTVADVDQAIAALDAAGREAHDLVIGIGGGSALDVAKAVAALAPQKQRASVLDYLEGVGRGLTLEQVPLPLLAMPTTGGTGSEATKNAVISVAEPAVKKSLRSDLMVPRVILVDPELTVHVSAETTAWTGMDAITQLVESYVSRHATRWTKAICVEGLRTALPAITIAVADGGNRAAREGMSHAALLSGMALTNSGLGMAHGVAAALGVHAQVSHGLACAFMLPVAVRANLEACEDPFSDLARQVLPAPATSHRSDAHAAQQFLGEIETLCETLQIPTRLSELGVRSVQIPELVSASRGNSMNGNPRAISDAELESILRSIL